MQKTYENLNSFWSSGCSCHRNCKFKQEHFTINAWHTIVGHMVQVRTMHNTLVGFFVFNLPLHNLARHFMRVIVPDPYLGVLLKSYTADIIIQGPVWLIYLGSKTTMTTGEWSCLISFAWAPLSFSERGGSEKFQVKIFHQRDSNPRLALQDK